MSKPQELYLFEAPSGLDAPRLIAVARLEDRSVRCDNPEMTRLLQAALDELKDQLDAELDAAELLCERLTNPYFICSPTPIISR